MRQLTDTDYTTIAFYHDCYDEHLCNTDKARLYHTMLDYVAYAPRTMDEIEAIAKNVSADLKTARNAQRATRTPSEEQLEQALVEFQLTASVIPD